MTNKEFLVIEKRLLSALPEFTIKGSLMFLRPVKPVLRGIDFDRSADKRAFYVYAFLLPACVPTQHLYFNFGKRIRRKNGWQSWDADAPNLITELIDSLKNQALPSLFQVESLQDFIKVAKTHSFENPHTPEAIGYALVKVGEFREANTVLTTMMDRLDMNSNWQREMAERAESLITKLRTKPEEAQRQVEIWETETLHNLKLDSQ